MYATSKAKRTVSLSQCREKCSHLNKVKRNYLASPATFLLEQGFSRLRLLSLWTFCGSVCVCWERAAHHQCPWAQPTWDGSGTLPRLGQPKMTLDVCLRAKTIPPALPSRIITTRQNVLLKTVHCSNFSQQ